MRSRGFTIIELMVTVFVIALLLTGAVSGLVRARKIGRDGQRVQDIYNIGIAVDQTASLNRGQYPGEPTTSTTFCADLLATPANNLVLTQLPNRTLPKDPLPATVAAGCTSYLNGYTYHRHISGDALVGPALGQHYEYAIEVGLELSRAKDDETLTGTGAGASGRTQYVLFGKPCTTSGTCTR
jgi:prepilin-type N-terminal cleavage/methylation domain-containing protein